MAVYATWDEVKVAYEDDIPTEHQPRIEALIKQASARLTALVPSLPARLAATTVDPDLPGGMVIEAVLRVYRNPAGITQQSTGPFSRSLGKIAQRNDIWFEPEQVQALLIDPSDGPGVGTFMMGVPGPQVIVTGLDADGRYRYTPEQLRGL